jgi:hypothetical protein
MLEAKVIVWVAAVLGVLFLVAMVYRLVHG